MQKVAWFSSSWRTSSLYRIAKPYSKVSPHHALRSSFLRQVVGLNDSYDMFYLLVMPVNLPHSFVGNFCHNEILARTSQHFWPPFVLNFFLSLFCSHLDWAGSFQIRSAFALWVRMKLNKGGKSTPTSTSTSMSTSPQCPKFRELNWQNGIDWTISACKTSSKASLAGLRQLTKYLGWKQEKCVGWWF